MVDFLIKHFLDMKCKDYIDVAAEGRKRCPLVNIALVSSVIDVFFM